MSVAFDEQGNMFTIILGDGDVMQSAGTARSHRKDEDPQLLYCWNMRVLADPVGVGEPIPEGPEMAEAPGVCIGVRTASDARVFAERMIRFADWIDDLDKEFIS